MRLSHDQRVFACGLLGPAICGLICLASGFISDGGIEKTLRLVIHFSHLKRSQFVDALNDRLAPELKKV